MRMMMIKKDTDLQALTARFAHAPLGGAKAIEEIQRLNPHVDLKEVKAGAVILLPDGAGVGDEEGPTTARDFFDAFKEEATRAMSDAAGRARKNFAAVTTERRAVHDFMKKAENAEVKALLEAAERSRENEDPAAQQSEDAFKRIQRELAAELAALAGLLR